MIDYTDERDQLRRLCDAYPTVARELQAVVRAGRIHGGTYWYAMSKCGCLCGWTAWLIGAEYVVGYVYDRAINISNTLSTERLESLILEIKPGDTPATSPALALVDTWLTEWLAEHEPAEVPA